MNDSNDKNNVYKCRTCNPQSIEFVRSTSILIDEYERPINMRPYKEVYCAKCRQLALLVKKDPLQAAEEAAQAEAMGDIGIKLKNEISVEPEEKPSSRVTKYKPYF